MAKKYLDYDGLLYFWQKLKAYFVKQESGKGLSTNDYTTAEKNKLSGIASGAEVNQNAFSNVKVGTTTIAADAKTDTVELVAGTNVTLTPDATNDKITIAASQTAYTNPKLGQGYGTCATASGTNAKVVTLANYELVTGGVVFVKFENAVDVASGSNVSLNINGKGAKEIRYKGVAIANKTIFAGDTVAFMYDGTYYQMLLADGRVNLAFHSDWTTGTNDNGTYHQKYLERRSNDGSDTTNMSYFTIYDATENTWGFMSAADKSKLDGIAAGAQVNSITGVKGSAESAYRTGNVNLTAANVGAIATTARGAANGVAPLNASSKIDSTYLPSFVDDVIEAYARSGQTALSSTWLATGSATGTVITPETGKIYILMADSGDYAANSQFRWSGSTYVKLNDGGVSSITNSEIDTIVAT